jgi:MOSC domain-containing protein
MKVAAIWRYPVKSMAGERVRWTKVTEMGLPGDRIVQVYDRKNRLVTARRFPGLLRLHATLGGDGEPLVDGLPWQSPEVSQRVEAAVAPGAHLARSDAVWRFDVLPLLICTDGAVSQFGHDMRRLRPNLLISGVDGQAERRWEGAVLRLPDAEIGIRDLRDRCVMTTFDPESANQDASILRDIVRRFEGQLCLNASVTRTGQITEGDEVTLQDGSTPPRLTDPDS